MKHFLLTVALGMCQVILVFGQDDFNGPNPFLLGAPVWKCDTSTFNQDTLHVPAEYASIQGAINACTNGDLILVAPGVYSENLSANGKEFGLASEYLVSCDTTDIYETVIHGGGGRGLNIGLEEHIKVIGLTFTGCSEGIYFQGNGPAAWHYDLYFSNLRLIDNSNFGIHGYLWRSGNYLLNSHVANNGSHGIQMINKGALYIGECLIENNGGHGIYNRQCGFISTHCKILNNGGDGVYSTYWGAGFTQYRCIIVGNAGDGVHSKNSGAQRVYNCTILNNGGYGLRGTVAAKSSVIFGNGGVHLVDNGGDPGNQGTSSFEYNLAESILSGAGNIQGDPQLNVDFAPLPTSPVFLAGHPDVISIGSYSPNGSNGYGSYATAAGMSIGAIQVNEIVSGCTEETACNYNSEANVDDGSCIQAGCMDPDACNYDEDAGCEDGSCDDSCCPGPGCCSEGMYWDWDSLACYISKPADINLDGCVELNDLLGLLSAYGECPPAEWACGDALNYQGYDYATVQIGEQCWFAENLRAENYRNGDMIPAGLSNGEWSSSTSGAVAVNGENAAYLDTYGRLYNWYAVNDVRGLCASGWHVPTDGEWITMELTLGMNEADANSSGYRGTDQGSQMKTTYGWGGGGNGTNSSGFSGLPGGIRLESGGYTAESENGSWWSSSPSGSGAFVRDIYSQSMKVNRYVNNFGDGFSVRCVKDVE